MFLVDARDFRVLDRRRSVGRYFGDHASERVGAWRKHRRTLHHQHASSDLEVDERARIVMAIVGRQVGASFAAAGPETDREPARTRRHRDGIALCPVPAKSGAVGPDELTHRIELEDLPVRVAYVRRRKPGTRVAELFEADGGWRMRPR